MKRIVLILMGLSISALAQAHDPNFSSFHLSQGNDVWNLRADLPWSIRNALINKYPFLSEKGVEQEIFEDCLFEYIDYHFQAYIDEQLLEIDRFYQIPGDHGHSYTYIFELKGPLNGKQLMVKNTCMFDLYQKQQNQLMVKTMVAVQTCTMNRTSNNCFFKI